MIFFLVLFAVQWTFARDLALLEKLQNDLCASPVVNEVDSQKAKRQQRDRELAFYTYAEQRGFDGLRFEPMYFSSKPVIETQIKDLKKKISEDTQNLEKAKSKINELEAMSDYEKEEWQEILRDNYRLEKTSTAKVEISKLKIRELQEHGQKKTEDQIQEFQDLKYKAYETFAQSYADEAMENDGFQNCGLATAEISAIRWFTATEFSTLNSALHKGGVSAEQIEPMKRLLDGALKKLNPLVGMVRWGVNLSKDADLAHQPGQIVSSSAYASASLSGGFSASHKFVIKSKTGRYIGPYSSAFAEDEVLFRANTKFKILEREGNEIIMEEVTP